VVSNVSLKLSTLQKLIPAQSGLKIVRGSADELRISIPWTALLSSPITLKLVNVHIGLQFDNANLHGAAVGAGTDPMCNPVAGNRPATEAATSLPEWLQSRITRVLMNIALQIDGSPSGLTTAARISSCSSQLPRLRWHPCSWDHMWEEGFAEPVGPQQLFAKSFRITDLMIECDSVRTRHGDSTDSQLTFIEAPMLAKTNVFVRCILPMTSNTENEAEGMIPMHTGGWDIADPFATPTLHACGSFNASSIREPSESSMEAFPSDVSFPNLACHVLVDYADFSVSTRQIGLLQSLLTSKIRAPEPKSTAFVKESGTSTPALARG
jgi:hypothetical protein